MCGNFFFLNIKTKFKPETCSVFIYLNFIYYIFKHSKVSTIHIMLIFFYLYLNVDYLFDVLFLSIFNSIQKALCIYLFLIAVRNGQIWF